ncbi:hypothetical protein [uncultured Campylobacter sp.]|uniref:hypothetical protein n=1 Tax=uncultured Campylobacter sp. TaxID=218934 RepID=UPI00262C1B7D|nr:hypothetical protein [uncultured Campylobacter sp.]
MSFCFSFLHFFIDIIDGKIAQIFDILTPSKILMRQKSIKNSIKLATLKLQKIDINSLARS